MEWLPLLIQLISGAAGGNIIGKIAKNLDLGPVGNTIAGALGGGGGAWILDMLMGGGAGAGGLDIGSIIAQIVSGGAGGGVLTAIVGAIRAATAK